MIRLSDFRIRPKLILLFLLTGIIPLLVVGLLSSKVATDALLKKSFEELNAIQNIRKGQIEDFFDSLIANSKVLAESNRIHELVSLLENHEKRTSTDQTRLLNINSQEYQQLISPYIDALKSYTATYNYYDLFIIDANHGHVLLTVGGEDDLGSNLTHGNYRDSGLAKAWRTVVETGNTALIDFAPYQPSGGIQAMFIAQPIRDQQQTIIGVLAMQISPELVTKIVDSRQGMGSTGESYLLGIVDGAYQVRSNLKTIGQGKFIVGYSHHTVLNYWQDAKDSGFTGGQGTYVDSANNAVLVTYNKLKLHNLDWMLISKIDEHEVTEPIRDGYRTTGIISTILLALICFFSWILSRTLTRPLIEDMRFAQAISNGDLNASLNINQKDEFGDLAQALNTMASNLQELDWLKSGKENLDDQLRGEDQTNELAKKFISFVTTHMDAQLGAIYLKNDDMLELQGSYAFTDRKGNFNRVAIGEGMVGQAALENQTITFSHIKDEAPTINYGAGEMIAQHFMAVPISFEGDLIGVMLLGSTQQFTALQKRFIDQNMANVAILFNAAKSRQTITHLLAQAQQQQEELRVTNEELEEQSHALRQSEAELQAQQEELRVTNEELEEQAKVLKHSESELQAQQEELRVTNEELEERTNALEEQKEAIHSKNEDLIKAQEIVKQKAHDLEIASKYKSEFLANMSHELRTPLNSILILSQLFANNKDGNLSSKQVESAQAINSSGSDLLSLINEILDLSKVEAGKIELVLENIQISHLIENLKRIFDNVASEKGLKFELEVADNLPAQILSDDQRLQQVLRNLLSNAFKFTHQGKVSLKIARPTAEQLSNSPLSADSSIAFAVVDEGIGIAQDKQNAIFQAFKQADGSTSRNYGGTGLGLSISKELSRLLGGSIHLESTEGQGSTFSVVIPEQHQPHTTEDAETEVAKIFDKTTTEVAQPVVPPTPVQQSAPQPSTDTVVPPSESHYIEDDRKSITPESKSLLIIEDDRNFAEIMCNFARERDFQCVVAEDGETGLHFADFYKPSAIILDIGLPGIDGWTVMERLKDNSALRHIPVHFMSANDSSLDAMRMGAIGYLSKPVSMEKVEEAFSTIEEIVEKPVRRLLLVEDDKIQQESIIQLIGNGDVDTQAVTTGKQAYQELEKGGYDCMILDLGLSDMTGFELLEMIRQSHTITRIPIIIYTGRDLTRDEEKQLNHYAESIIIKGVKSPERLLDESALFLHRIEANLPEEKQNMLKMVHDKETVLNNKTVLLVDDDMRNVFALSSVLEERGMEIVIAKNGAESLDQLEKHPEIDVVLMDIMMPVMDGYEAMRKIRQQRKFAKLPVLALTAKAMKGDRSKCIEAGANDYLAKPVNTDKLISMLRVWLY